MDLIPITITPRAAAEIKTILAAKKVPEGYGLRVGMKGGGCGGMSYLIGFDKPKEMDKAYLLEGIPVYIDKRHVMYLLDVEIGYEERETEQGFVFEKIKP